MNAHGQLIGIKLFNGVFQDILGFIERGAKQITVIFLTISGAIQVVGIELTTPWFKPSALALCCTFTLQMGAYQREGLNIQGAEKRIW